MFKGYYCGINSAIFAYINLKLRLQSLQSFNVECLCQIDYQVQWWQHRNEQIIHDVTSVKYNKENEIVSHQLTCFPRLNKKSVKTETKEYNKFHLFYCKKKHFILKFSLLLIILSDTKSELTLVTTEDNCTESVQILRCHLFYQNLFGLCPSFTGHVTQSIGQITKIINQLIFEGRRFR